MRDNNETLATKQLERDYLILSTYSSSLSEYLDRSVIDISSPFAREAFSEMLPQHKFLIRAEIDRILTITTKLEHVLFRKQ